MRILASFLVVIWAVPAPAATACDSPEHRQLDFWIGDWDVVIRSRKAPGSDEWSEQKGTQRIEAILGGCAISESFAAVGAPAPWAGRSYSMWQPALGKWRQTWVDDQGSYLAFTGGLEGGTMALYGEPTEKQGKKVRMRMVFLDVRPGSMRWEWQKTTDEKTWTAMMVIQYRRKR
jgi:hypothetical protein